MRNFLWILAALLMIAPAYAEVPTRTLPIIYVNTQNGQDIVDKETQIPATVYIDSVLPEYAPLGSEAAPLTATIKGRGNWTWTGFDKKPYKLKFDTKTKVLGMPKNRHWCLMASADDWLAFLKMPAGFALSEAVGLRWTPRTRPVEFILNGQYMGLYFLTEHVRIGSNRVNIVEQAENETDPDSITGGWLVEIDNYWEEGNVEFHEGNGQKVMVTIKEPEIVSAQQRAYIENQLLTLNDEIYKLPSLQGGDGGRLSEILDIDEAARYYIVQEIMEDCESYHGSCFLYKDRDTSGVADKWKFGPVWDFGNAYNRDQDTWIYVNPTFAQYWIGQLAQHPVFQQAVAEQWWIFYHERKDSVRAQIREFADQIQTAAARDAVRWKGTSNYCDNSNFTATRNNFFDRFDKRINWLYSQWGEGVRPLTWGLDTPQKEQPSRGRKVLRNGRLLIELDGQLFTLTGALAE